jgi:UDP-N-acetylglucosamine--dolichyl-phosphate N-acetylglucosaminephosphotransferase
MAMEILLVSAVFVSFFLVILVLPSWIAKCRKVDLVWEDMNKYGHPKNVASSGGIVVIMAFILGVLFYIALKTFLFGGTNNALEIFSLLTVVLILGIVGLTDDLLGWHNHGLPMKTRIILAFMASIPLVVINAGSHVMSVPLIGSVDFGIFFPIFLIPLGIAGASTTYNFLAGFNGLEAGQGILILSFLSFVSFATGSAWLAILGLCMVGALLSFYIYNKYPAKVFPGDTMTYSIGALIAAMAILGNFEKIAVIVFIPYIIEVFLKARGGLKKHSFGKANKDGSLSMPYDKIYGLEHLAIFILNKMGTATEKKVVYLIYAFQILFILIAFLMI